MSDRPQTLIKVSRLPDGRLEYEDWQGRREAVRPEELGARCEAILADPRLPKIEQVGAGPIQFATEYLRLILPKEHHALAGPLGQLVFNGLRGLTRHLDRGSQYRAQQAQQQRTYPEPPPHRNATRRGHRVA